MFWKKKETNNTDQSVVIGDESSCGEYHSFEKMIKEVGCPREELEPYDFTEWDSRSTRDASELKSWIDPMNLPGRKIKDIRFISHVYNMSEDDIAEIIWNMTEGYPKELQQYLYEIEHVDDLFPFPLDVRMDEPVLVKFEDGDQFEILTSAEGRFKVNMNKIPWNAKGIVNQENVKGSVLFDLCIGAEIKDVKVETGKAVYGPHEGEGGIESVTIKLCRDTDHFDMVFRSDLYDYMTVSIENYPRYPMFCPFIKVKQSLYKE